MLLSYVEMMVDTGKRISYMELSNVRIQEVQSMKHSGSSLSMNP